MIDMSEGCEHCDAKPGEPCDPVAAPHGRHAACTMACAWKQRQASEHRPAPKLDKPTNDTLFGGRTVTVVIQINTDEDLAELAERMRVSAAGPNERMVRVSVGLMPVRDALRFWEAVRKQVAEKVGRSGKKN